MVFVPLGYTVPNGVQFGLDEPQVCFSTSSFCVSEIAGLLETGRERRLCCTLAPLTLVGLCPGRYQ